MVMETLFVCLGKEANELVYKAYWIGLQDLSIEQVKQATGLAMRNCKFVPKPIELREMVEGTKQDAAELAWIELQQAIPLGPYKHIDFCDGVINATVRSLGGWPSFLSRFTSADEEKWARKDFMQTYQRLSATALSDEAMAYLPGITEMKPMPVRIASNRITQSTTRVIERR
jgi:hypothetical protein